MRFIASLFATALLIGFISYHLQQGDNLAIHKVDQKNIFVYISDLKPTAL